MGIRREEVIEVIRSMFIPQERPENLTIVTGAPSEVEQSSSSIPPAPIVEDVPSIFPMVQPMKTYVILDRNYPSHSLTILSQCILF